MPGILDTVMPTTSRSIADLTRTIKTEGPVYQEAEIKCRKLVYKQRIRLKEFFQDFDRLRTGFVFENQFLSGLSMAGIDKVLRPNHLQALADAYKTRDSDTLCKVDYRRFCEDMETVFTQAELEKDPLREVPEEPYELLDKTRYDFSSKQLGPEQEAQLERTMDKLRRECRIKGIMVKPFFDDPANNKNSARMVNHVTVNQFRQGLDVKMGLTCLSQAEIELLIQKYMDADAGDMVNYVALARTLDPGNSSYN